MSAVGVTAWGGRINCSTESREGAQCLHTLLGKLSQSLLIPMVPEPPKPVMVFPGDTAASTWFLRCLSNNPAQPKTLCPPQRELKVVFVQMFPRWIYLLLFSCHLAVLLIYHLSCYLYTVFMQPHEGRKQCSVTQPQALKCPDWSRDGSREDAKEKENCSLSDCSGRCRHRGGKPLQAL